MRWGTLWHIYVPGHSVDQRDVSAGETYFFHADLQSSVQAVVDSGGALAARYVYTPDGRLRLAIGPWGDRH
ncbi:MAG: hypothetical protein ACRBEQ_07910 [Hyphomonas sp.]